ncbi:unnamed protein product [Protopolystoma xenopodis]|uniref:Uncharacterized protein n=1 Tax=Protopolystoma xenopodis TaxID=117903 RepID=A0A3S5CH37_9PLAT|nr:unnamed protein product [Protopolystoma xenopodis]
MQASACIDEEVARELQRQLCLLENQSEQPIQGENEPERRCHSDCNCSSKLTYNSDYPLPATSLPPLPPPPPPPRPPPSRRSTSCDQLLERKEVNPSEALVVPPPPPNDEDEQDDGYPAEDSLNSSEPLRGWTAVPTSHGSYQHPKRELNHDSAACKCSMLMRCG